MWPFTKRTVLEKSGIFQEFIDWHSHILPGVDDGVRSMEESLQILSRYEELGIKEVWLTPHIMEDIPNTTDELRKKFKELTLSYRGNIALQLASENMLDNLFEKRLAADDLLPLGKEGRYLLVETSYFNPPVDLKNVLLRIKAKGYFPMLAHPERYRYMDDNNYRELKTLDVKFQLNLSSLSGAYGTTARKKAQMMLKKGYYDMCGSDIHSASFMKSMLCGKYLYKEIKQIRNILNKER